jgi:hypothetical protein
MFSYQNKAPHIKLLQGFDYVILVSKCGVSENICLHKTLTMF